MKLPAAVVTAGMISLGFATSFPELPPPAASGDDDFPPKLRSFCETLKRVHIVVALISVTSELIAVLWAAVEVNQLTERVFEPTLSVWELIQRDCDLAWSAVNSHFVMGIIGFVAMLSLRAYVMLIAARASRPLMSAALCGTTAALCLMISIVNRGVQAGGGNGIGYGGTILDLLQHYAVLLYQAAINYNGGGDTTAMISDSAGPGPLQFAAIALEAASIGFVIQVLLTKDGDKQQQQQFQNEIQLQTIKEEKILLSDQSQPIELLKQPPKEERTTKDNNNKTTTKRRPLFFANKNNNKNFSAASPSSSPFNEDPLSLIPPANILESQKLVNSNSNNMQKKKSSVSNPSPYAAVPSSSSSSSPSLSMSSSSSPSSSAAGVTSQQQPLNGDLAMEGAAGGGISSSSGSSSADDLGGGGGSCADDGGGSAGMG